MKWFLLLALLAACGKKTVYTYPPLPEDQASDEVKKLIKDELTLLEKEFAEVGVKIDLHQLPVVVAPLPNFVLGRCQYGKKNQGAYIILSENLFFENKPFVIPTEGDLFESEFSKVLIHEIGHCYFMRPHEQEKYLKLPGSVFELKYEGVSVIYDKIPTSIMPAESRYRMPKSLRKYYLAELAGKANLTDLKKLEKFTEFQLISNQPHVYEEDSRLYTIESADENRGELAEFFKCSWSENSPKKF